MMKKAWLLAALTVAGPVVGRAEEAAQPLQADIKGDAKDEVPLTKERPAAEISFDKVATLSREGQTDRVLQGPVEHMTGLEQMKLLEGDARQVFLPLPVRLPKAPFIRMEISPGLTAASWELQMVDQEGRSFTGARGTDLPRYVVEWDGFDGGDFKLKAGPAYTPVLVVKDERGKSQRYFGEPVQYSAVHYIQDGRRRVEFDNSRLFERGRTGFAAESLPLLEACLHLLRKELSQAVRVTVPSGPLAAGRAETLKDYFTQGLAIESDMLSVQIQGAGPRGDVTDVSTAVQ